MRAPRKSIIPAARAIDADALAIDFRLIVQKRMQGHDVVHIRATKFLMALPVSVAAVIAANDDIASSHKHGRHGRKWSWVQAAGLTVAAAIKNDGGKRPGSVGQASMSVTRSPSLR